jgi:fructuronate reductase
MPQNAALPAYDRAARRVGIVHFGLGAFTRAHQAWYTDRAMAQDGGDWMIAGISLRSPTVGEQLNPQEGSTRWRKIGRGHRLAVIGSVAEVLLATTQRAAIPASGGAQHPYRHLHRHRKGLLPRGRWQPRSGAGRGRLLPAAGRRVRPRKAAGIGGLTLLSCDNLADNGHQLRRLMGEYLAARHPDLLDWVQQTALSVQHGRPHRARHHR